MRLLYITYIDFGESKSGSSVRPQKIYKAFLDAGHEVKLLQESLSDFPVNLDDNYLNKFEVIYHYIIFRQLELIEQHGYKKVIDYAICSIIFIMLYANKFHDDHEAVRRWSEQIEYNEDNIELIINKLSSFY